MPSFEQSIRNFMRKRCIPNGRALAAWIQKIGVNAAAKDSGISKKRLNTIVKEHFPTGPAVHFSPTQFGLGCVVDEADAKSPQPQQSYDDKDLSVDTLGIYDDANLPTEHWIDVPRMDSSTDQGKIGSCVSWSGAHLMDNAIGNADNNPAFRANPTTIYGFIKGHNLDPWPTQHGSTMEALADALYRYGAPSWDSMPVYREAPEGNPANLPHPEEAVADAKRNLIQKPRWIREWNGDTLYQAMCLMHGDTENFPGRQMVIATAFYVPDSIFNAYTAETGIVMMPHDDDEIVGGHAVAFIGWREFDGTRYFIVKNSWGTDFGDGGYLYVPEAFIKKYFKKSFVAPALARESLPTDDEDDKEKAQPKSELLAIGGGIVSALLIVGLITLLISFIPKVIASDQKEAPTLKESILALAPTLEIDAVGPAEQMFSPEDKNVFEIYSRTLRLIDEVE